MTATFFWALNPSAAVHSAIFVWISDSALHLGQVVVPNYLGRTSRIFVGKPVATYGRNVQEVERAFWDEMERLQQ